MNSQQNGVLSYQDFVERWCKEEDATFRSGSSASDILPAAKNLKLPRTRSSTRSERPATPAYRRWSADWEIISSARQELFGRWHHYRDCPWCDSTLHYMNAVDPYGRFARIERRTCGHCGWWDTDAYLPVIDQGNHSYSSFSIHRRALLKVFDVASGVVPVIDLGRHIARHPESIFRVEPHKLEELVASIFERTMDCRVDWLGGPGDGGIDLLLVRGDGTYAVQVKRKSRAESPTQVSLVREFVGAMFVEGIQKGIFVTTSSFSKPAERTAVRASHRPGVQSVELLDGRRLVELCGLADWSNSVKSQAEHYEEPLWSHHLRDGMDAFYELGQR